MASLKGGLVSKATVSLALEIMARGSRKLAVAFGACAFTHYGGVYLLHRFFSRLRPQNLLTRETHLVQRNHRDSVGEMFLALLYPMILGLDRIETTKLLRQNGVFQYLTGLPSYLDATTLRRFLLRVAPTALVRLRKLHDRLLRQMSEQPPSRSRVIFDLDSTVWVVYGSKNRHGLGTTRSNEAVCHTTLCSASRARARTFGMASCDPAMPIRPGGRSSF